MAIYKANLESGYTVIPNETAQNKNLSFEARGMLSLLLSLPVDWSVNKAWLINQSGAGRDKVQAIINELVANKYMSKTQPKKQNGQFTSNDYFVYPSPVDGLAVDGLAVDGLAVDGLAVDGKSDTTKETVIQKKQYTNLDQSKIDRENLELNSFEYWWKSYPKKVAKASAFKSWKKVIKKMDEEKVRALTNHIVSDVKLRLDDIASGSDKFIGFDRLHATTYLNQERYNDDI